MSRHTSELISIAGSGLGKAGLDSHSLPSELGELLRVKNGFYAFESALHVFPCELSLDQQFTLEEWNGPLLWRSTYGRMAEDCLFFAEDVFGGQFAYYSEGIVAFEPESGEITPIASTLEEWAAKIIGDYSFWTGFPLAHEWQTANGNIVPGQRLVPKRPFILGGDYSVNNLYALDAAQGMRYRGEMALQLKNLPEGSQVSFGIVD